MATTTQFTERLVLALTPCFADITDPAARRTEILAALASYGARTCAELLHAAQAIAFGIGALDLLGRAASAEMSDSLRLRTRSAANALHRSANRAQAALRKSLACDVPQAGAPPPAPPAETLMVATLATETLDPSGTLDHEQADRMPAAPGHPAPGHPLRALNRLKSRPHVSPPGRQAHAPASTLAHLFAAMVPPGVAAR